MTYEQFKTDVLNRMQECLPAGKTASLRKFRKINGIEMDGIIISDDGNGIAPVIYLNFYYDKMKEILDVEAVCKDILQICKDSTYSESVNVELLMDYKQAKEHLIYRVINYGMNKELLQTVPHVPYLDLAVVFYCLMYTSDDGEATVLVNNDLLERWGVTVGELHRQAHQITPKLLPYTYKNLNSLISEMSDVDTLSRVQLDHVEDIPFQMHVLTNSDNLHGAACILYDGVLQQISEGVGMDLFVLPSSIHEVIVLPAYGDWRVSELANMVTEINHTEVSVGEVLSNSVYYYSKALSALQMCD